MAVNRCTWSKCMKIGHGFHLGIYEFGDLGIEGVLSILIYALIPQFDANYHRSRPKKLTHFKSKFRDLNQYSLFFCPGLAKSLFQRFASEKNIGGAGPAITESGAGKGDDPFVPWTCGEPAVNLGF